MANNTTSGIIPNEDEITLRDLVVKVGEYVSYLKGKWVVIFLISIIGSGVGLMFAYTQKTKYIANLSFALEDDKSGSGGISGAVGLASSLGIDVGANAGGAFSGSNLIELMKSRTLIEKALLNPIVISGKKISLADYFIEFNGINEGWQDNPVLKNIRFEPSADRTDYTLQKDSILGKLYSLVMSSDGILSVSQKDKKVSIINIEVSSINELFAKAFTESIAKEISEFYVETKSKKAKLNVAILEQQTDSIRNELNAAITGVASVADNTFNLNPALNSKRIPSTKRQIDVQTNTAILTQLVTNLEMAKLTLLKETPLIQVIDKPILPLKMIQVGKFRSVCLGGILAFFIGVLGLVILKALKGILQT